LLFAYSFKNFASCFTTGSERGGIVGASADFADFVFSRSQIETPSNQDKKQTPILSPIYTHIPVFAQFVILEQQLVSEQVLVPK
jgi:hypothetical protein